MRIEQGADRVAEQPPVVPVPRRRGDRQRHAIVQAVRELLEEKPFAQLSVSTISDRAGVARSGFYFYFDSKYAVLAQILADATHELEELTEYFAPRGADESPAAFAKRMVGSAAAVYAHNDPVMSACNAARNTDAEIRDLLDQQVEGVVQQIIGIVKDELRAGTAHPISDDIPTLVRTLSVTTAQMLSGDTAFLGADGDVQRGVRVLEALWLNALWGGSLQTCVTSVSSLPMAKKTFAGKRCLCHRCGQRHRPGDRSTARRPRCRAVPDRPQRRWPGADGGRRSRAGRAGPEHRALDIANYDEVTSFAEKIHANHPSMDLVMNIAGVSAWGTVDRLSHEQWDKMVSINLMGPIHVIENFLPPMVAARNGGHLVNVSSAAGLIGLPWHAAYSASKFGLRGLSEVLRFDLARYRIGVSVVVPGAVRTPLVNTVEIAGVDRNDPQVSRWVDRFSGHAVSPQKAADKILAGIAKNRFLIYTSSDIRALYAFKRVAWWPYSVAMRQVNLVFTQDAQARSGACRRASAVPAEPSAVAPDGPARTGPAPAAPPRQ